MNILSVILITLGLFTGIAIWRIGNQGWNRKRPFQILSLVVELLFFSGVAFVLVFVIVGPIAMSLPSLPEGMVREHILSFSYTLAAVGTAAMYLGTEFDLF